MKKEIFALSLLLLLFAASLFNIWTFDRLCLDIAGQVSASAEAMDGRRPGPPEQGPEHMA